MDYEKDNTIEYPCILKVELDGTIIALDKFGDVNTELNAHTLTQEQEYKVFGKVLYEKYYHQNMSRYERNKNDYDNESYSHHKPEPDDYYTERDKKHDWEQQQELNKCKKRINGYGAYF